MNPPTQRPLTARPLQSQLRSLANPQQAAGLARFFKTAPGEYGEGDVFLGIKVPVQRKVAAQYNDLPLAQVVRLLHSKLHEERLTALLILVRKFATADAQGRGDIYKCYLANTDRVNNWDLVDLSAPQIVGAIFKTRAGGRSTGWQNPKTSGSVASASWRPCI